MKNIVTVGGGGGHAQVLKGLKLLPNITIIGICPSTDSGGSTGILSRDYGCPGYLGDLTKCIAALCRNEKLAQVLLHRFESGCLHGHSLKNILLLGLTQANGMSFDESLEFMYRMCETLPHRVIPVSHEHADLCATLSFGGEIRGETNIDNLARNPLWSAETHAIEDVHLCPKIRASKQVTAAISTADYCIICPGDLYSSIVPTLLPVGIQKAFRRSRAKIIVVLNIMTKQGETDGYRAEDFVREIEVRIGKPCDVILYNTAPIPRESLLRYRMERKIKLSSRELKRDSRVLKIPLIGITGEGYLYHDPLALAKVFGNILTNRGK
jgi:uncharacterized cofD-like protein